MYILSYSSLHLPRQERDKTVLKTEDSGISSEGLYAKIVGQLFCTIIVLD